LEEITMTRREQFARRAWLAAALLGLAFGAAAADGSWLRHVPDSYRRRANPFAGQADAAAAGGRLFSDHCAACHGADANGRGKRPSMRSGRVQHATDGELFWLLKNGSQWRGMPTWSAMPEESRWQIITFIKSLGS
jgi:mono/diheme cytochrome c family protein